MVFIATSDHTQLLGPCMRVLGPRNCIVTTDQMSKYIYNKIHVNEIMDML